MTRLFVAVRPPEEVLDVIDALPRPSEPGVRWVRREHWHVTLRFLGPADPEAVVAALDEVDLPLAWADLGPVVSRLGRDVVCLPVHGLDELAAAVVGATRDLGRPPEPRPFHGHLTLARLRRRAACGVTGERVEARFRADRIELVDSTLTADGAIHRLVATWRPDAAPGPPHR